MLENSYNNGTEKMATASMQACEPDYSRQAERLQERLIEHRDLSKALRAFLKRGAYNFDRTEERVIHALFGELELAIPSMTVEVEKLIDKAVEQQERTDAKA
jgi:hypothetical protein